MDPVRLGRLTRHFDKVLRAKVGERLPNAAEHDLFLEALCAFPDPVTAVSKVLASDRGLAILQAAMRSDLRLAFLNGRGAQVLKRLAEPSLENIDAGLYLQQVLVAIAEPPIFWNAFLNAFNHRQLSEDGQYAFAWLLFKLAARPPDQSQAYRAIAADLTLQETLSLSNRADIRSLSNKIKNLALNSGAAPVANDQEGPGGRHDNDFADYRQIAILPTSDELTCKEKPFLRTSQSLEDPANVDSRVVIHLDNQFRSVE